VARHAAEDYGDVDFQVLIFKVVVNDEALIDGIGVIFVKLIGNENSAEDEAGDCHEETHIRALGVLFGNFAENIEAFQLAVHETF